MIARTYALPVLDDPADITGPLGWPSKMPGCTLSLPASACITGSRLRSVKGSVCEICYAADTIDATKARCAARGTGFRLTNYSRGNVRAAMDRRLANLDHPLWVDAATQLIDESGEDYFRWFDSGDLQSMRHFRNINEVCKRLPRKRFWLPTKEHAFIRAFIKRYGIDAIAPNLVIRLSAYMVGEAAPSWFPTSSTVDAGIGRKCRAYLRDGKCGLCRACWSHDVPNIDYHVH